MDYKKVRKVLENTPKKHQFKFSEFFYQLKCLEQNIGDQHKREIRGKLKVINGLKEN